MSRKTKGAIVKRSVISRLGAVVAGVLLLSPLAACGTPPAKPKISAAFGNTLLTSPAGIFAGTNANFTYRASGIPRGGSIFLQKASLSGTAIKWSNVSQLDVQPLGSGTIIRAPFGRNTYRLGVFDAHGKGLTSAPLPLDVYKAFTFSELTTRKEQTLEYAPGKTFPYVFQAEIFIENTSCRVLGKVSVFNNSALARRFEFAQTIKGKTKSSIFTILGNPNKDGPQFLFKTGQLLTLGEDLDLHILDNDRYGGNVYADGGALCLTDTGGF